MPRMITPERLLTWPAFVEDLDELADARTGVDPEQGGRGVQLTLPLPTAGVNHHLSPAGLSPPAPQHSCHT